MVHLIGHVPESYRQQRFDQTLAAMFPGYSRSCLQRWLKAGVVRINGRVATPKERAVAPGAYIEVNAPLEPQGPWLPALIDLDIVYEDASVIVLDKPAGLIVHPGAGQRDGTLVNALLYRYPDLSVLPRAGIVHRLDKHTTGLMVVARTLEAHHALVQALTTRRVARHYVAVVHGQMTAGATVNLPLARHPKDRTKMAVVETGGRAAITHFRIRARYPRHTALDIQLETGRTHQIRVHMAHIGHPLVGDTVYGRRRGSVVGRGAPGCFGRQALTAVALGFDHPLTGQAMRWEIDLPADLQELLAHLE